jgi:Zn-dependent protease with chaperone function
MRRTLLGLALVALTLAPPAWGQMTPGQRTQVSDQMARELERGGRLEAAQGRVERIFVQLLRSTRRHDVTYRVALQRSAEVNAYALPDGRVVVTTELLHRLPAANDSAVAFVLAHEISHVELRHAERTLQQEAATRTIIGVLTGGGDDWVRLLGGLSNQLIASGHSRGQEAEADRAGLELMNRAGYDPNGALVTLRVLEKLEGSGMRVFPTHPRASDRYKNAVAWMNQHHVPVHGAPAPRAAGRARQGFGGAAGGVEAPVPVPDQNDEDGDDPWTRGNFLRFAPPLEVAQARRKPAPRNAKAAPTRVGVVPVVVLRDRTGHKVALSHYLHKKPIAFYFYNRPAERTADDLQNLQTQMDDLGIQAIAIQGDRGWRDRAIQQFQTVAIAYPVLLDDGTVARLLEASADPTLVLVAPDGREIKRWTSFEAGDKLTAELRDALREVVASPSEH